MATCVHDRDTLRALAHQWMEWAAQPVMAARQRAWRAVHDLRAERPVILFETAWIDRYVAEDEVVCEDPFLRAVERNMRITLRQAAELNDDLVIEPHYQLGWRMQFSDYGVPVDIRKAPGHAESIAYSFSFPITTPQDVSRLAPRQFRVDRAESQRRKALLEDVIGDILPVRLGNYDPFVDEFDVGEFGDLGFTGNFFFGLTWQVYRFIGNEGLLYWVYDAPEAIHQLMQYMLDDRTALFSFLEREGVLARNTDSQMAGPRSYGFVSDLPASDAPGPVRLKDLWGWAESQEADNLSPAMYQEFVLPYLAKLSEQFGLVYYGCCEHLHDRLPAIIGAIPNLRSVSVSGWSDLARVAELLGRRYVFSRKPTPAHISGATPHWELLEKDMRNTYAAARDLNLEILFRDVYTVDGDRSRLRRWVDMTKSIFQM
ncbi:MAG: uroporphyrinogen decarboxylase family protein [Pirellulaceae bacterium]|jgi:hypothetical protein|nr:uroporphyrinogen decarboxylase family protein [Pirellulaceae bacterium]